MLDLGFRVRPFAIRYHSRLMHAIEGALRKSDRPATDVRQTGATDAPTTRLLTRHVLVSASLIYTASLGRIVPQNMHDQTVSLPGSTLFSAARQLLRNGYCVFQRPVKPARPQTTLRTASGALSPFTLAPETPARRSCHRGKSDHVHPVAKRLSIRCVRRPSPDGLSSTQHAKRAEPLRWSAGQKTSSRCRS